MKIAIALLMLSWTSAAHTSAKVPCWIIEGYIKAYGSKEAAIKAAKEYGWTDADIAEAKRRCRL